MASHYDLTALKRSLVHFLTGKALTAICSIAAMLLLARALPKTDFAALIIFEATINLTGVALSFGVSQPVLLRYIPELRVQNNGLALYGLVRRAILHRAWIYALACVLLGILGPWLGHWFGFDSRADLFSMYLFAGWANLMLHPIFASMESLLWQKTTQYIIAATAALRLLLLSFFFLHGRLDLHQVVLIEIAYQSATLLLLLVGFWSNRHNDPHRHQGTAEWFADNRRRIARYAWKSYGFSLSSLLIGSQPNRMVAGRFLSPRAMGDYGFADSLTGLFGRFLPSTLLQGFIRPLYFARFTETNQLHHIERLGNMILRINLVLMAQAALLLLMFGGALIDTLTAGKYGDTVNLIAAMFGVLVLGGMLNHYTLICQTVEKNALLIYANLFISASIAFSFPLFPEIGAWAIVAANTCGLVMAIFFLHYKLAKAGWGTSVELVPVLKAITAFAVPLLLGVILQQHLGQMIGGFAGWALSLLLLVLWGPFTREDINDFRRILAKRLPSQLD